MITDNNLLIHPEQCKRINSRVSYISDNFIQFVPNIGIIEGDDKVLLIDTGIGTYNGDILKEYVSSFLNGRELLITTTHFHPEHAYGLEAFKGAATIIYNEKQKQDFLSKGENYLKLFKTFGKDFKQLLDCTHLVEGDKYYSGRITIDLGNLEIELIEVGGGHTLGDQIIYIPKYQILFTGDLIENRVFPIFPYYPPSDTDVNGYKWINILKYMIDINPNIVVPGHGDIGGVEIIQQQLFYLEQLKKDTLHLLKSNCDIMDIEAQLELKYQTIFKNWRESEWIRLAVRNFVDKKS
ncbi:MBL fold metallo-hydrolase [Bacillus pretiosus]|uniref:MBL fold metallo-hydrolase n=1 Tax=Bacillus pretiosus TaxID=2983392 RepID=UPI003D65417F